MELTSNLICSFINNVIKCTYYINIKDINKNIIIYDNSHNIEEAFDYAVDNKWVRKKDCYVLNHKDLIDGLAIKYRTSKKSGNRVNVGNHFVIKDTNGNVIYNPA